MDAKRSCAGRCCTAIHAAQEQEPGAAVQDVALLYKTWRCCTLLGGYPCGGKPGVVSPPIMRHPSQ
jgi:hypothetical protein